MKCDSEMEQINTTIQSVQNYVCPTCSDKRAIKLLHKQEFRNKIIEENRKNGFTEESMTEYIKNRLEHGKEREILNSIADVDSFGFTIIDCHCGRDFLFLKEFYNEIIICPFCGEHYFGLNNYWNFW